MTHGFNLWKAGLQVLLCGLAFGSLLVFAEEPPDLQTLEPVLLVLEAEELSDLQSPPTVPDPPDLPQISTSRPSVTDTSLTVPLGSLQFENGATYMDNRGDTTTWVLPETLIRYGLTEDTEFRFVVPNYNKVSVRDGVAPEGSGTSNFGDIQTGFSHHWEEPGQVDVALISLLNIPTGANNVSSNSLDPEIRIAASKKLTSKVTIASQIDARWYTGQNPASRVVLTPTLITYYYFKPTFCGFLEWAGSIPTEGRTSQIVQTGLLYVFKKRHQLDARVATGLNSNSPEFLVGFGYSFRLDGLFGH